MATSIGDPTLTRWRLTCQWLVTQTPRLNSAITLELRNRERQMLGRRVLSVTHSGMDRSIGVRRRGRDTTQRRKFPLRAECFFVLKEKVYVSPPLRMSKHRAIQSPIDDLQLRAKILAIKARSWPVCDFANPTNSENSFCSKLIRDSANFVIRLTRNI